MVSGSVRTHANQPVSCTVLEPLMKENDLGTKTGTQTRNETQEKAEAKPSPGCPAWRKNAERYVTFLGDEDEYGRILTTVWIQPDAFDPRCNYTTQKEFNITIDTGKLQ